MRPNLLAITALSLALAVPLAAQGRGRNTNGVPPGHRPPPGLCRIWLDGVPPGQQPGVLDCVTARATVPPNGRVIYGDQTSNRYVLDRTGRTGTITTRRVYDDVGNLVLQRVRRNADGTYTVLSSTPVDRTLRTDKVKADDRSGAHKAKVNNNGKKKVGKGKP